MRRWRYDAQAIHDVSPRSAYWGWHGFNLDGWVALLAGVVVCLLTINAPIFHGPVSEWLDGADFTWTLGPLVSRAGVLGSEQAAAAQASSSPATAPRACRRRACGRCRARAS